MPNDTNRTENGQSKCLTGKNPYGLCDCNIVCGYIYEPQEKMALEQKHEGN